MALPSQVERSVESSRPVMSKPSGGPNGKATKVIGVAIVVLSVGGLAWGLASALRSPTTGDAKSAKAKDENKIVEPPAKQGATPTIQTGAKESAKGPLSTALAKEGQPTTPLPGNPHPDVPKPAPVDVTGGSSPTRSSESLPGGTGSAKPSEGAGSDPRPSGDLTVVTPAGTQLPPSGSSTAVRSLVEQGDRARTSGRLVEARSSFSKALLHPDAPKDTLAPLRDKIAAINAELLFSKSVTTGDPICEQYTVASGDALERIAKRRDLATRWELIQRVNGISDPGSLKVGQKLKLIRGPFHAVVTKSDYRLDLFWGSPDDPDNWLYIRSFKVGLGDGNGTPTGTFTIRNRMKNPSWKNPRTGESFGADDPKNPIGEFWLGWQGQGAASVYTGFGLHGTIDPSSIGQQKSMGCVRMGDADIAMMWEFLTEQLSVVKVVP